MNILRLNNIAIWRAKLNDNFRAKKTPAGRVYYENNIARKANEPIFSYAKNYTLKDKDDDIKYCLFVCAFEHNEKMVEKYLDDYAKELDPDFIKEVVKKSTATEFEYTNKIMEIK